MSTLSATPGPGFQRHSTDFVSPPNFILQWGARDKRDGTKVAQLSVENLGGTSFLCTFSAISAGEFPAITRADKTSNIEWIHGVAAGGNGWGAGVNAVSTNPMIIDKNATSAFNVEFDINNTLDQSFTLFVSCNDYQGTGAGATDTLHSTSAITFEIDKGPLRAVLYELGQI